MALLFKANLKPSDRPQELETSLGVKLAAVGDQPAPVERFNAALRQ